VVSGPVVVLGVVLAGLVARRRHTDASLTEQQRRRASEIGRVLARHGLGWVLGPSGVGRALPYHRGLFGHPRRALPYTRPEHVRLALEDLGPTFVKLGQILSSRADLLPPRYQAELARLHDAAPAEPWPAVLTVLDRELAAPAAEVFASIDPTPLAAASIGQAHAAVLHDGTDVVVKVRRPGALRRVQADLDLVESLATRISRRFDLAARYDVVGLSREFAATLRAELDYAAEAANVERFAENFAGDPNVHIPRVYRELSTTRVLTLERLRGIKVDDLDGLAAAGIDRQHLARRAARLTLQMVYRDGFFHADPHPGNFFIEPDGTIGLVDFGMVGTVDDATRGQLTRALFAVAARDGDTLVDAFLTLGFAGGATVGRTALRDDLAALFASQLERPLGDIVIADLFQAALAMVRHHHLVLPTSLALLLKTMVMSEGLGARLDPSFRLMDAVMEFASNQ
jgi:ubiquinone biosynthesis protein